MERKEQDKSQELRDVHFLKYLIGYMYFFFKGLSNIFLFMQTFHVSNNSVGFSEIN